MKRRREMPDMSPFPKSALSVRTANSIYIFSGEDEDGIRSVSLIGGNLDFSYCKILNLEIGECSELVCIEDGKKSGQWLTGRVAEFHKIDWWEST